MPEDFAETHTPRFGFMQWKKTLFTRYRDYRGDWEIVIWLSPLFLKKCMRHEPGPESQSN